MNPYFPRFPKALSQKEEEPKSMSVTVFRQSTILDRFTQDELRQVCFALDYKEFEAFDWNRLRIIVGNLLLDKQKRVFKDQGGIINIIEG